MKRLSKGFSLVEMIIALGIGSVAMYYIAQVTSQSNVQTKYIEQKLDTFNTQTYIASLLKSTPICTCNTSATARPVAIATDGITLSFDSTAVTTSTSIRMKKVFENCTAGSTPYLNENVYLPSGALVKDISLKDLRVTEGVNWAANLTVTFESAAAKLPKLKPIRVPVLLTVDNTTPTSTKIVSCASSGDGSGPGGPPAEVVLPTPDAMCASLGGTWEENSYCVFLNQKICENKFGGAWDPIGPRCLPTWQ